MSNGDEHAAGAETEFSTSSPAEVGGAPPSNTAAKGGLFGDDDDGDDDEGDADLFGSLDKKGGSAGDANAAPLFGDEEDVDATPSDPNQREIVPPAPANLVSTSPAEAAASPPASAAPGASSFLSKLSSSGLLESSGGGLFGDDDEDHGGAMGAAAGAGAGIMGGTGSGSAGGGGGGLFDDIDAQEAERERQEREQAAAEEAAALMERLKLEQQQQFQQQQQQQGQADQSMDNGDVMHELNLDDAPNDYSYYGMGMGMGLGAPIERDVAPQPQGQMSMQGQQMQPQYSQQGQQQYGHPVGQTHYHQRQQQQHLQQPQGVMNAMAGSYYYSTTGAGQMQGQPMNSSGNNNPANSYANTAPKPSVLAGMHVGHNVHLGGVPPSPSSNQTANMNNQNNINNNNNLNDVVTNMNQQAQNIHPGQHHYSLSKQMGINTFAQVPSILADYVPPPPFDPLYGKIEVNDPMLIQGSGLFAGPPHWTYLVTVYAKTNTNTFSQQPPSQQHSSHQPQQPISAVRRRFRHFVALETRLRASVPGAILPPRPDKHPARAIEEATARQSADFAMQRARELTSYMNALSHHPHAGQSPELKLFLTLQDHIGTAWPEVSSSAFTRMTAVGTATLEKVSDSVDGMLAELGTAQQVAAGEDSAEILALAAYEGRRIGAVTSSVPKIEGAVGLVRERGDRGGATGLEMGKLAKDVAWCDRELSRPMEVLSSALLRCGRRTKRLGLELGAAIAPFSSQYRLCRYEQMAFGDRRTALKKKMEARTKADGRAAKLMMNQTSMQHMGRYGTLERMETEAAMMDEFATEAAREAEEVAMRLQNEVARIGALRVTEWDSSMKVIASGMKEACAENAAIWESALEAFKREFPDLTVPMAPHGNIVDGTNNIVS